MHRLLLMLEALGLALLDCIVHQLGIPSLTGWVGESRTRNALLMAFGPRRIISNLYLLAPDGNPAQIDNILFLPQGLFVVETKNLVGRIYGEATDRQWAQETISGTYPQANPIRQVSRQVAAVRLAGSHSACFLPPVLGIVHITGPCRLMNDLPAGFITYDIAATIRQQLRFLAQIEYSTQALSNHLLSSDLRRSNPQIVRQHRQWIRDKTK